MKKLEENLNYCFKNMQNLIIAVTHSSYVREHDLPRTMCNERLEFLGDTVLETVVREEIFRRFPNEEEGFMTKLKSDVVRSHTLATVARGLNLGQYLKFGKGEIKAKAFEKDNMLENAMEAVIGAIFYESGYDIARDVVLRIIGPYIDMGARGELNDDYKSELQNMIQSETGHRIKYNVIEESGKSHDKTFKVELRVDDVIIGKGTGKSKKSAENMAAKEGVRYLKNR